MINLLKNQFIGYLNIRKPHLQPYDNEELSPKYEDVSIQYFDIMDKNEKICQPLGSGSATYHNPQEKTIRFIDYENFISQLPQDFQKDLRKCDFIAYDTNSKDASIFILNELSQSNSAKNKINDARQQLHQAAFYFHETKDIHNFITNFKSKKCIFSNKNKLLSTTPNNNADAFSEIQNYLKEPIIHHFQPITKLGYEFIETAIVEV